MVEKIIGGKCGCPYCRGEKEGYLRSFWKSRGNKRGGMYGAHVKGSHRRGVHKGG